MTSRVGVPSVAWSAAIATLILAASAALSFAAPQYIDAGLAQPLLAVLLLGSAFVSVMVRWGWTLARRRAGA